MLIEQYLDQRTAYCYHCYSVPSIRFTQYGKVSHNFALVASGINLNNASEVEGEEISQTTQFKTDRAINNSNVK